MQNLLSPVPAPRDRTEARRLPAEGPDTSTVAADERAAHDLGLFIIWKNARHAQDRILTDLAQRFELLRVYEMHWSPALMLQNFQRFYADMDLRGIYHALRKGAGPFLLATVVDPDPSFERRETTRGWRTVNANLLDPKQRYRDWTGPFLVHSTETAWETNRDLSMLLGVGAEQYRKANPTSWDGRIETIARDIIGANGWDSLQELFWVLNRSVNYAAIFNAPPGDDTAPDIDLVTDNYWALHALTNTRLHPPIAPDGGRFTIIVDDRPLSIGIRFAGDGYYDPRMAADMLRARVLDPDGYYRPSDADGFVALAYQTLAHKAAPGRDETAGLIAMASKQGIAGWTRESLADPEQGKSLLRALLQDRGYACCAPRDRSVPFDRALLAQQPTLARRLADTAGRQAARARQAVLVPLLGRVWRSRDRLLLHLPLLRTIKMRLRGIR